MTTGILNSDSSELKYLPNTTDNVELDSQETVVSLKTKLDMSIKETKVLKEDFSSFL